jgi:hypothetical protein
MRESHGIDCKRSIAADVNHPPTPRMVSIECRDGAPTWYIVEVIQIVTSRSSLTDYSSVKWSLHDRHDEGTIFRKDHRFRWSSIRRHLSEADCLDDMKYSPTQNGGIGEGSSPWSENTPTTPGEPANRHVWLVTSESRNPGRILYLRQSHGLPRPRIIQHLKYSSVLVKSLSWISSNGRGFPTCWTSLARLSGFDGPFRSLMSYTTSGPEAGQSFVLVTIFSLSG